MGFLDTIKQSVQKHLDKKKEERERIERIQKDVEVQENIVFEKKYRENALKVAIDRAERDAERKSGIQRLQARNRVNRLKESQDNPTPNTFAKFRDYTQRNLARQEENLKRTAEMREVAKKMREENLGKKQSQVKQKVVNRGFSTSTWKP